MVEGAKFKDFNHFVDDIAAFRFHDPNSIMYWDHWRRSQWSFLADENDCLIVDKVYRFETRPQLFLDIAERHGIEGLKSGSLPHLEKTGSSEWERYYEKIDLSVITPFLAQDCKKFGYPNIPVTVTK